LSIIIFSFSSNVLNRPKDFSHWEIEKNTTSIKPTILKAYKLIPLGELLTDESLAPSADYGINSTLDVAELKKYFKKREPLFCKKQFSMTEEQCLRDFLGKNG